jgi:transposase-like protein
MGGYKRGKQYRAGIGKTVVAGAVERGGKVFTYLPKDGRDGYELTENIRARVTPETMIFTDETLQYNVYRVWVKVISTVASVTRKKSTCAAMFVRVRSRDSGR